MNYLKLTRAMNELLKPMENPKALACLMVKMTLKVVMWMKNMVLEKEQLFKVHDYIIISFGNVCKVHIFK